MSFNVGEVQVPFTVTDGHPVDIESEAAVYLHQMFSGTKTIEDMITILARFKESSEQREKLLFDCIIHELFQECKFFSIYPTRQLRIAALLYGFLIKHQLVTHIPLGIALRAVLDALRKPADSQMFVFGSLALEQFVERMNEWPQYSRHVLQISHLRANRPELVVSVERALDQITTGPSEPDIVQGATSGVK